MQEERNDQPLRLVVYTRVSTEGQAEHGVSPVAQEEACRAWAVESGHQVVGVCRDDGLSGQLGTEDRPAIAEALLQIEEGRADGVVVAHIDRLARELHTQEAILAQAWAVGGRVFELKRGEILEDDPDDPYRTFLRQVMGAAAQLEAGMVRLRMRRGRQRKAALGGYVGGRTLHRKYGFELVRSDDGRMEYAPVPCEQEVISRIRRERDRGESLRSIASALNGEAVSPPSGSTWWPKTIALLSERTA